jgi:hypothetical protein
MLNRSRHRCWRRLPLRPAGMVVALLVVAAGCSSGGPITPGPSAAGRTPTPTAGTTGAPPTAAASPTTSPLPAPGASVLAQPEPWTVPSPRYRTMGAASGDSVFLLGGLDPNGVSSGDVYRIQPTSGQVGLAGHLATPTHGAAAVSVGSQILVFGGADVSPDNLVQAFNPATGATSVIGHMPGPRADLVGAAVGADVFLLAGFNGSAFISDVWATRDGTSLSVVGQIARPERYPAIAVTGTTIYLFGGLTAGGEYNGTFSTVVQSFDVATGQSRVIGQLSVPLAHARAAVVDGEILVFGGWTPAGPTAAILRFDPADATVTPAGSLPGPVADEAIGTVGGAVYLASGLSSSSGGALRPLVQVVKLSLAPAP